MNKHLFTLTELLVTIAIILILTGILIGGITFATRRAEEAKTIAIIEELAEGMEKYKAEKRHYPIADGKVQFKRDSGKLVFVCYGKNFVFSDESGKQFCEFAFITSENAEDLTDTWDNPLYYKCPGSTNKSGFDLWSYGPDGASGNTDEKLDDITNWKNDR